MLATFSMDEKVALSTWLDDIGTGTLDGLSSMDNLWATTDTASRDIIETILRLDPQDYGFRGPDLGLEGVPSDAVTLGRVPGEHSGEYALSPYIYIPKHVYAAFTAMAAAFQTDYPERELRIGSCYRSPAFQMVTLVYILVRVYDFDLAKTLKRVALPQYSQHCSATQTAVDMLNIDGEPSDEEPQKFKDSVEYAWLKAHGHEYGFAESYPPNNPDGIMWEPWHWCFRGAVE